MYENRKPSENEIKAKRAIGKIFESSVVDSSILEIFPYEYPHRAIHIEHTTDEFTCVCPFSGLPDYATLTIRYIPNKCCIELKSLKYYLYSYRQVKIFNEHVVNKILEDLVKVLDPFEINIIGKFTPRGGIVTTATAFYEKKQSVKHKSK